jgi:hypothetical protein
MAKFRVRFKVQGLELEIDGERGDIPAITSALEQQFSGMMKPAEAIADGRKQSEMSGRVLDSGTPPSKNGQRAIRRRGGKVPTDGTMVQPLDYRHDSSTYGSPLQIWNVLQKTIWQLLVIERSTETKEMSCSQLTATFNQQFKSAGKLRASHVSRELGKAKGLNPAPVGEDKERWFLTAEGQRQADELIRSVLNPS